MRQVTTLRGASARSGVVAGGHWIAFVSTDSGGDGSTAIDPQGTVTQRLTFNTWEWDKHPSWSPDGGGSSLFEPRHGAAPALGDGTDGSDQRNLSNNV